MCTKMLTVALPLLAIAAGANAAVTAYEGFDGSSTGFATSFPAANGSERGAQVPGLSYHSLVVNGFAREGGQAWANRGVLPQNVDSGVVWMSWLYKTGTLASDWTRVITATNGDIVGSNERYNLGAVGDTFTIRGVFGASPKPTVASSLKTANDTTYMLVAAYDFGAAATNDGVIRLWVNPSPASLGTGSEPTGGTLITASGISDDAMAFNAIGHYGQAATDRSPSVIDELRIGQTWVDVSPVVPEPATLSLVSAAVALGTLARRRR